jgi:hypothetical protein
MAGLGISELALNVSAFQVFEKPPLLTLVMAAVVGLGLPLCAHFLGAFLKQWPRPAWRTAIYVGITAAIAILCLNGVTIARSQYLLGDRQLASRDEILQQAFFYINLFVFLTATVASYFSHEEDPDFDNMRRSFFVLDAQCGSAHRKLTDIVKQLRTIQQAHEAKVSEVQAIVRELVYLYRRNNRLSRDGDSQAFQSEPVLPPVTDEPLRVLGNLQLAQLFEEWSNVDRTPHRQPASVASV